MACTVPVIRWGPAISFVADIPHSERGRIENNTIVVVCVLALEIRKRSIINILSTRCVVGLVLFWSYCETCAGAQSEKPTGLRDQPVRSAAPHCDSSQRQLREARKTATDPDSEQY